MTLKDDILASIAREEERERQKSLSSSAKVKLRLHSLKCGIVRIIKKTKRGKNDRQLL